MEQQQPQRVRVEDALSYLDQVKTQFAEEPHVYTQFLDIMKDFKSQAIDTPGVITRVSQLFRGKPSLIIGFNTFLPTGFEVIVKGSKITIVEPNGVTQVVSGEESTSQDAEEEEEEEEIIEEVEEEAPQPPEQPAEEPMEEEEEEEEEEDEEMEEEQSTSTNQIILNRAPKTFNHTAYYVNKIKVRFQSQPAIYKQFLQILQSFQQKIHEFSNDATSAVLTEKTVMEAISSLFANHQDLIEEFRWFLPDAAILHRKETNAVNYPYDEDEYIMNEEEEAEEEEEREPEEEEEDDDDEEDGEDEDESDEENIQIVKEVPAPPALSRFNRPAKLDDALQVLTDEDVRFFNKMRRVLTKDQFRNAMRHLDLYAASISTRPDILRSLSLILQKHPALLAQLDEMIRHAAPDAETRHSESALSIDYSSCKLLGLSYRSLPESYPRPVCSGRTELCKQVLNDTFVSFPSWSSEDSSSVSSKKSQFEEFVYRTEDERFELDIILEVNKYAIDSLEKMRRRLAEMKPEDAAKMKLDEKLGATSESLMIRALRRVYGEHWSRIIETLKKTPSQTIPIVLERFRTKEREWKDAQVAMNKIWREQLEKQMVKALDHQGTALKHSDSKWIRAKTLISQIENLFDEQQNRNASGPQMCLEYPQDRRAIIDANHLLIHYVRRLPNMSKEEKKRVKRVIRSFLPELFCLASEEMSDDEDKKGKEEDEEEGVPRKRKTRSMMGILMDEGDTKYPVGTTNSSGTYRLIYGGNVLYVLMRVHHMLVDRLGKIRKVCEHQLNEWRSEERINCEQKKLGKSILNPYSSESMKALNKLRAPRVPPYANFDRLMSLLKQLLDGNIEPVAYEEEVRTMLPTRGYLIFTLDKVISTCVRQLQMLACEDNDKAHTLSLYNKYRFQKAPMLNSTSEKKMSVEAEYGRKAESTMEGHNCYRMHIIDIEKPQLTIELLEGIEEDSDGEEDKEKKETPKKKVAKKETNTQKENPPDEEPLVLHESSEKPTGYIPRRARPTQNDLSRRFLLRNVKKNKLVESGWSFEWMRRRVPPNKEKQQRKMVVRRTRAPEWFRSEAPAPEWLLTDHMVIRPHPHCPSLSTHVYKLTE